MASKRCPLCRKLSEGHAVRCGCGYQFGQQIDETLRLLRDQRSKGYSMASGGALIVVVGIVLVVAIAYTAQERHYIFVGVTGWIGGFTIMARGAGMVSRARASTRELEKMRELPTARVV
jgi:hypothetical protein